MDKQRTVADGRIEELEHRLEEMEDRQSALERSRQVMNAMVPAETRKHIRAAWRENLLAVRSLLDAWIEHFDGEPKASSDNGREDIPID